jgi:2-polyprenyl-3-methyl-5-hydroxy-6-metoxy-1,4-benzoquinol methylase
MTILKGVQQRCRQPEIMDQPDLDSGSFTGALRALERINWISGSAGILWPRIMELARSLKRADLRLLDVATGAGDVPLRLRRRAQKAGWDLHVEGCDLNRHAVAHALGRARARDISARFFAWDAVKDPFPNRYDIVTSSLFLHHLDEPEGVRLLANMMRAADHLVLVNDLVRSRVGYWLAYAGTRFLSGSKVAHVDGPRSVESAYSLAEARELARRAGLEGARVERRFPCRYLLSWQGSAE